MQCGEHALGGAGYADQASTFQADDGQTGIQGQSFYGTVVIGFAAAFGINAGAGETGVEGIADQQRQAARHRRGHGLRVDHFGAEVSQLAGFAIAQCR